MAPCSHVWHYKCIRPILNGSTWPNFLCPNCRAVADLEADVEDMGDFESWDADDAQNDATGSDPESQDRHITPKASTTALPAVQADSVETNGQSASTTLEETLSRIRITHDALDSIANSPAPAAAVPVTPQAQRIPTPNSSSATQTVSINVQSANDAGLTPLYHHMNSGTTGLNLDRAPDCPMTPRNDVGPFVLDGSAGRAAGQRLRESDPANATVATPTGSAPQLPPVSL